MDYIQDMLLRQRQALAVLLLGGETADGQEPGAQPPQETAAAERERTARGLDMHRGQDAAETGAASGRQAEPAGTGAVRRGRGETAAQGRVQFGLRKDGQEAGPVHVWTGPAGAENAETAAEARAVSRAVQRDARRYDGGFSIY